MRKVILVAFYFNQLNEIASKRLRALAKYLPMFGWEPIVIAPNLGSIPKENDDLDCRIIYVDYEDMFSHYLNKFNFKKSISNSKNSDDECVESENKLKDSGSVENPLVSKAISLAGEVFAYPDGMKYWFEPAFKEISTIIENEDIDAIISSSWPITAHTIAKNIKNKYDLIWIADLRDLWNLNPYISHTHIRNYFEKNLEIKTFENADALTTTTDLAAETLSSIHPNSKIVPILSGYDEDDFKVFEDISHDSFIDDGKNINVSKNIGEYDNKDNNKLNFIYAGSLYSGKRDPSLLFKAIRDLENEGKLNSSKISIDFYGDNDNLELLAKKYGLLNIINIGGRISHKEVLQKQAQSDILLLISWNNEKEKMFIPGKVYEYFALKKPVLSIGYKEGSLKDLIEETKIGCHVSNLESTKKALLNFYNEFIDKGYVEFKSDANIKDYSMVSMTNKFANLLDELSD